MAILTLKKVKIKVIVCMNNGMKYFDFLLQIKNESRW